jgi:hypothetical protein
MIAYNQIMRAHTKTDFVLDRASKATDAAVGFSWMDDKFLELMLASTGISGDFSRHDWFSNPIENEMRELFKATS